MENEKLIIEMLQKITTGMDEMKAELKAEISEVKAELKAEISEVKTELKAEISEVKTELKAEISEGKAELKTEISEVKTEVKALNQRFDKLGEMFEHTVQIHQEAVQKIDEALKYQAYKIAEFDREIFILKHKQ